MGRLKTHEERQRKIMKNKELKKLIKLNKKGKSNEKNNGEITREIQDSAETNVRD